MSKYLDKQQQALDDILAENLECQDELLPDQVIAIFKSSGRTSMLAQLFKVKPITIAQIKGQRGKYRHIILAYKHKIAKALITGGYHEKVVQF